MSAQPPGTLLVLLALALVACDKAQPSASGGPAPRRADVRATVPYVDGTKHGEALVLDERGRVRKSGRYDHDRKTGTWTGFDGDGDTLEVVHYANGLLDGESRMYGPGGVLLKKITYRRGRMHGAYEDHHPDGALYERVSYRDGQRHGPYLRFTRKDTLDNGPRLEGQYSKGSRTGIWRRYYGNGVQSEEGPIVDDRFHGRWTYWDRRGRPRLERVYVRGALVYEGPPR